MQWLMLCRGCELSSFGFRALLGTHVDWCIADASRPRWRAKRWIPVAADGCGDHYVLLADRSPSPVAYFDIADDEAPGYLVASSFAMFLHLMLAEIDAEDAIAEVEESAPSVWFDRESLMRVDPAAVGITGVPFAWDGE